DVLVPTATFAATANAVTYCGARPCFIDADPATWQMSPTLLAAELDERRRTGQPMPAAVITVDLYGACSDYGAILAICADHGIPVVEDAAEALGATHAGRPAGSFGAAGVLSFNGNKIITTSSGGALLCHDRPAAERARYLATQARRPAAHYEHTEIGFNYRLSNLLAAFGRGQLATLDERIGRRREIQATYREALAGLPSPSPPPTPKGPPTPGSPASPSNPAPPSSDPKNSATNSRHRASKPGPSGSRCTPNPSSPTTAPASTAPPTTSSPPASASPPAAP